MNITSIIIIITFLAALAEKFSKKPASARKGILKKLKLENIAILLLGFLLLAQLRENIIKNNKEAAQEAKTNEAHEGILTTKEKVDEANELIDSVLLSLKKEIEFTREEFELISFLNKEMAEARKNISKSLIEYQKLNSSYSKQLELEREKVKNAKPDVRIFLPKSTKDSLRTAYQFQLTNYGQRVADSVVFFSVMILTDTTDNLVKKVTELKTNSGVHNILSLPPNQGFSHIANSVIILNEEVQDYGAGYLLIKYRFFDFMTKTTINLPVSTFRCTSLKEINTQYGNNVEAGIVKNIKRYLLFEKPELYKIFFEE
ncbi:MAG: hypothetical protein H6573_28470 [Lewinellaceae bacterium]|nr:hypothetical protein [Lewinellaceae bacterium]